MTASHHQEGTSHSENGIGLPATLGEAEFYASLSRADQRCWAQIPGEKDGSSWQMVKRIMYAWDKSWEQTIEAILTLSGPLLERSVRSTNLNDVVLKSIMAGALVPNSTSDVPIIRALGPDNKRELFTAVITQFRPGIARPTGKTVCIERGRSLVDAELFLGVLTLDAAGGLVDKLGSAEAAAKAELAEELGLTNDPELKKKLGFTANLDRYILSRTSSLVSDSTKADNLHQCFTSFYEYNGPITDLVKLATHGSNRERDEQGSLQQAHFFTISEMWNVVETFKTTPRREFLIGSSVYTLAEKASVSLKSFARAAHIMKKALKSQPVTQVKTTDEIKAETKEIKDETISEIKVETIDEIKAETKEKKIKKESGVESKGETLDKPMSKTKDAIKELTQDPLIKEWFIWGFPATCTDVTATVDFTEDGAIVEGTVSFL